MPEPTPPPNPKVALYQKMFAVMADVPFMPKNGFNEKQRYAYATDADITLTMRNLLLQHGLLFLPPQVEQCQQELSPSGKQLLITAHVTIGIVDIDTGESYSSTIVGQGADMGDKGIYKAITGAIKYWLLKTFMIPTGDDPEADQAPAPDQRQQQPKPAQPSQNRSAPAPTAKQPTQRQQQPTNRQSNKQNRERGAYYAPEPSQYEYERQYRG